MKLDFSQPSKITFKITNEEKEKLNKLQASFIKDLEEYALSERDDLDCELSQFYRSKDKISKLHAIRFDIVDNLLYEEHFKGLVIFDNGRVIFSSRREFYLFANGYNILDDPSRGYALLKNHILVQVIDHMVEVWYSQEVDKEFEFRIEGSTEDKWKQFNYPFTEKGLDFFEHCLRVYPKVNRRLLSTIYHYFKSRDLIRGNQLDFAHYYNQNHDTPTIRIYPGKAGLDPIDWKHRSVRFLEEEERKFFRT